MRSTLKRLASFALVFTFALTQTAPAFALRPRQAENDPRRTDDTWDQLKNTLIQLAEDAGFPSPRPTPPVPTVQAAAPSLAAAGLETVQVTIRPDTDLTQLRPWGFLTARSGNRYLVTRISAHGMEGRQRFEGDLLSSDVTRWDKNDLDGLTYEYKSSAVGLEQEQNPLQRANRALKFAISTSDYNKDREARDRFLVRAGKALEAVEGIFKEIPAAQDELGTSVEALREKLQGFQNITISRRRKGVPEGVPIPIQIEGKQRQQRFQRGTLDELWEALRDFWKGEWRTFFRSQDYSAAGLEARMLPIQQRPGIVLVSPADGKEEALRIGRLAAEHGLAVEVAFRGDNPQDTLDVIKILAREQKESSTGVPILAGTVKTAAQAEQAISHGAQGIITPGLYPEVIHAANRLGVLVIPGVGNGEEAQQALAAGAYALKGFPYRYKGIAGLKTALMGPMTLEEKAQFDRRVEIVEEDPTGALRPATFTNVHNRVVEGGRETFVAPLQGDALIQDISGGFRRGVPIVLTGGVQPEDVGQLLDYRSNLSRGINIIGLAMSVRGDQAEDKLSELSSEISVNLGRFWGVYPNLMVGRFPRGLETGAQEEVDWHLLRAVRPTASQLWNRIPLRPLAQKLRGAIAEGPDAEALTLDEQNLRRLIQRFPWTSVERSPEEVGALLSYIEHAHVIPREPAAGLEGVTRFLEYLRLNNLKLELGQENAIYIRYERPEGGEWDEGSIVLTDFADSEDRERLGIGGLRLVEIDWDEGLVSLEDPSGDTYRALQTALSPPAAGLDEAGLETEVNIEPFLDYLREHALQVELRDWNRIYVRYNRAPEDAWNEWLWQPLVGLSIPRERESLGVGALQLVQTDLPNDLVILRDQGGAIYEALREASPSSAAGLEEGRFLGADELYRAGDRLVHPFTGSLVYEAMRDQEKIGAQVELTAGGARVLLDDAMLRGNYRVAGRRTLLMKADDLVETLATNPAVHVVESPSGQLIRSDNPVLQEWWITYGTLRRATGPLTKDGYVQVDILRDGRAVLTAPSDWSLVRRLSADEVASEVNASRSVRTVVYPDEQGNTVSQDKGTDDLAFRRLIQMANRVAHPGGMVHLKLEGDRAILAKADPDPIAPTAPTAGLEAEALKEPVAAEEAVVGYVVDAGVGWLRSRLDLESPYLVVAEGLNQAVALIEARVPRVSILALVEDEKQKEQLQGLAFPGDNVILASSFSSWEEARKRVWQMAQEWVLLLGGATEVRELRTTAREALGLVAELEDRLPPAWGQQHTITAEDAEQILRLNQGV